MSNRRTTNSQSGAIHPLLILVIVLAVVALGFWFVTKDQNAEPEKIIKIDTPAEFKRPPAVPERVQQAPDIPLMEQEDDPILVDEEPVVTLPPLSESDQYARNTFTPLSDDPEFALWLQPDNLLQKASAIIDGFSRGNVLYKLIPIQPPVEAFKVRREDDRIYLDEANFQRFDAVVNTITRIPPEGLATSFQQLRPLFEEAFAGLGNPGDKVDNSLIAAIDLALETPAVPSPIALKQESVLFQFADPDLEALPPLQKQLIRMGPDNQQKVLSYLTDVRSVLLQQSP